MDLPDPGIKLTSLASPTLVRRFFTTSAPWEATNNVINRKSLITFYCLHTFNGLMPYLFVINFHLTQPPSDNQSYSLNNCVK